MKCERGSGRRLGGSLLLLFIGLGGLAVVGLGLWGQHQSMTDVALKLKTLQPWLTLWRFLLYGVVIGGWPHWITGLARTRGWDETHRTALLALRGRVAVWFLLLELMLAQNIVGLFTHAYLV